MSKRYITYSKNGYVQMIGTDCEYLNTGEKRDEKPEFLYESDFFTAGSSGCAFL